MLDFAIPLTVGKILKCRIKWSTNLNDQRLAEKVNMWINEPGFVFLGKGTLNLVGHLGWNPLTIRIVNSTSTGVTPCVELIKINSN